MERRLGVGLESLFGLENESMEDRIEKISLDLIQAAPWQPRKEFDEEGIVELAASIKEYGILQPIILKQKDDHYEIIAGERRFRAAQKIGLTFIPAVVVAFTDQQSLEVSMIENLQRRDLTPIEKAEGFKFLIEKLNMTQEALSEKLGFSRAYIANFLRLTSLSDDLKNKVNKGAISVGHAKILASQKDASNLADLVVEKNLSVRDLEALTKKSGHSKKEETMRFEAMLSKALNNAKTSIAMQKNSGEIKIKFKDLEELEWILSKICL